MTRRVLTLAAVTAAAVICVLWALAALAAHHAINPGHTHRTHGPRT